MHRRYQFEKDIIRRLINTALRKSWQSRNISKGLGYLSRGLDLIPKDQRASQHARKVFGTHGQQMSRFIISLHIATVLFGAQRGVRFDIGVHCIVIYVMKASKFAFRV